MSVPDRSIPFYNLILRCDRWQRRDPALPEGFAFPDQLNWLELEIAFNDVTGAFQATVPSADGKQSAVFVCYKFAQEDGSTKCGVNTVIFH